MITALRRHHAGRPTSDATSAATSESDRIARHRSAALAIAVVLFIPGPAIAQTTNEAPDEVATEAPNGVATGISSPYLAPEPPVLGPAPADWPSPATAPATAYVLVDAETGQVLAGHDADEPRAVASTVKVLTALSVVARTDLDDPVTVGEEVAGVPGAGVGLVPGNTWRVEQLLDALISRSGNEAAEALAVHVGGSTEGFIEMMLADAEALGLGRPPLVSASGLDNANQLSAMDLATVARAALADEQLRPFLARREVVLPSVGRIETRNQMLLIDEDATGVKTGYTREAGYSLIGSARRDGRELIAVVLDAGDEPARFEAATTLLEFGFEQFRPAVLEARVDFAVAGGLVTVRVPETRLVTPTGTEARMQLPMTARPPEGDVDVDIEVLGDRLGTVVGHLDTTAAPAPASGDAAIGRAMVDGTYAALRAAAAQDVLR